MPEQEVFMITNDSLGFNIWKVGENCEALEEGHIPGPMGALNAIKVYGSNSRVIALMCVGPGITVHYRDKETRIVHPN